MTYANPIGLLWSNGSQTYFAYWYFFKQKIVCTDKFEEISHALEGLSTYIGIIPVLPLRYIKTRISFSFSALRERDGIYF